MNTSDCDHDSKDAETYLEGYSGIAARGRHVPGYS